MVPADVMGNVHPVNPQTLTTVFCQPTTLSFLIFINDFMSVISSPFKLYDVNSTLHFSFHFERRHTLGDLQRSTSDISRISN